MTLQTIKFEYDIPDGYRFVAYRKAKVGESYLKFGKIVICEGIYASEWPIIEKIPQQQKRKHADLIHAWADGAEIQWKFNNEWIDCDPEWDDCEEYRIKPKTKTVRFRNYLTVNGDACVTNNTSNTPGFKTWLGDWQEAEIEE